MASLRKPVKADARRCTRSRACTSGHKNGAHPVRFGWRFGCSHIVTRRLVRVQVTNKSSHPCVPLSIAGYVVFAPARCAEQKNVVRGRMASGLPSRIAEPVATQSAIASHATSCT